MRAGPGAGEEREDEEVMELDEGAAAGGGCGQEAGALWTTPLRRG